MSMGTLSKPWLCATLFLLLASLAEAAELSTGLATKIDPLFSMVVKTNWPGGEVLVARDGRIIFEKGYGFAQVESRAPCTDHTRFRIGSITKQFTSAAIFKLAENGKLRLDDHLSKFIPDWPRGDQVTLRHLLTHTSGIHNFTDHPGFYEHVTEPISMEALIASFRNDAYDFNPGEKYSYCNSGYVLLGHIVEKVSGEPYGEYLRKTFLKPLGMKNTGVYRAGMSSVGEAFGYSYTNGMMVPAVNWEMSKVSTAGELYSTAHDLFLWNEAIFNHRALSEASLKTAFTVGVLKWDDPTHPEDVGYACGWTRDWLDGAREISHGGELWGFGSYLLRLPEYNLTVVVLLNCAPHPPGLQQWVLAREIARRVLGSELPDGDKQKAIEITPVDVALAVGRYDLGGGAIMTVTTETNHVFAQITGRPRFEMFPKSDRTFFVTGGNAEVTFVRNPTGRVVKVILKQGGDRIDAQRVTN
jgi:CubicO group peptidase (beta-lactamase class C family)